MADWLKGFDQFILGWIHDHASSKFFDDIMVHLSAIGNVGLVWITVAVLLLCTKKYRQGGIVLLLALASGYLVGNLLLKPYVARARPIWPYANVARLIPYPKDFSFPSGHALSSFTAAAVLTIIDKRFCWFAIPLAYLIALSRLYLYVHYPSDVLAGMVIGTINGKSIFILWRKRVKSKITAMT